MLCEIAIQNFRCLKKVSVPLRELTVLVGANDTGKTAFLDAIRALIQGGIANTDLGHGEAKAFVKGTDSEAGPAELRNVRGSLNKRPATAWRDAVNPLSLFRLPSSGVAMTGPGQPASQGPPPIGPQGENVPALMDYLLRKDRERFYKVVRALKELVPGLEDIDIDTPSADTRQINLIVEKGYSIDANRSSTGVRFLIFFVALAYHPDPPKIILIEEPESGIHPKRLVDVMRLMRQVSQGQHGAHPAQVIITTHSPYLLDLVDLKHDQVLVFCRQDDGSRSVSPADSGRLAPFLDEFLLGEVWSNEGESGLLPKPT